MHTDLVGSREVLAEQGVTSKLSQAPSLPLPLQFSHPAQMSILKMLGETSSCRVCALSFQHLKATEQILSAHSRTEFPNLHQEPMHIGRKIS